MWVLKQTRSRSVNAEIGSSTSPPHRSDRKRCSVAGYPSAEFDALSADRYSLALAILRLCRYCSLTPVIDPACAVRSVFLRANASPARFTWRSTCRFPSTLGPTVTQLGDREGHLLRLQLMVLNSTHVLHGCTNMQALSPLCSLLPKLPDLPCTVHSARFSRRLRVLAGIALLAFPGRPACSAQTRTSPRKASKTS